MCTKIGRWHTSEMSTFAFTAIYLATLRETVPKFHIALDVEQEDTLRTDVQTNHRRPDVHTQLVNPETSRKEKMISCSFQAAATSVCSVEEITIPPIVSDDNHHLQMPLLLVQVFPLSNMHLVLHTHLSIHNHLPHELNLHCMYAHPLSI